MKEDIIKSIVTMSLVAMLGCAIVGCTKAVETTEEQITDSEHGILSGMAR